MGHARGPSAVSPGPPGTGWPHFWVSIKGLLSLALFGGVFPFQILCTVALPPALGHTQHTCTYAGPWGPHETGWPWSPGPVSSTCPGVAVSHQRSERSLQGCRGRPRVLPFQVNCAATCGKQASGPGPRWWAGGSGAHVLPRDPWQPLCSRDLCPVCRAAEAELDGGALGSGVPGAVPGAAPARGIRTRLLSQLWVGSLNAVSGESSDALRWSWLVGVGNECLPAMWSCCVCSVPIT